MVVLSLAAAVGGGAAALCCALKVRVKSSAQRRVAEILARFGAQALGGTRCDAAETLLELGPGSSLRLGLVDFRVWNLEPYKSEHLFELGTVWITFVSAVAVTPLVLGTQTSGVIEISSLSVRGCNLVVETDLSLVSSNIEALLRAITEHWQCEEKRTQRQEGIKNGANGDVASRISVKLDTIEIVGLELEVLTTPQAQRGYQFRKLKVPDIKIANFSERYGSGCPWDVVTVLIIDVLYYFLSCVGQLGDITQTAFSHVSALDLDARSGSLRIMSNAGESLVTSLRRNCSDKTSSFSYSRPVAKGKDGAASAWAGGVVVNPVDWADDALDTVGRALCKAVISMIPEATPGGKARAAPIMRECSATERRRCLEGCQPLVDHVHVFGAEVLASRGKELDKEECARTLRILNPGLSFEDAQELFTKNGRSWSSILFKALAN